MTDLMVDMGWISILMLVGSLARRYIGWFRALLIPAPITAGMPAKNERQGKRHQANHK